MDLDAYVAAHEGEWRRLQELTKRRRLSGQESDELLDLYQRTATHLSYLRSAAPDPTVLQYLSTVLARARSRAVGTRTAAWAGFAEFFVRTFPAMLYRARWWWLTTMAVNLLVAFAIGWWVVQHPGVQTQFIPPDQLDQLVNKDFESYYSEYAATDFAFRVWTNNVYVAAICLAGGALGFPVLLSLWSNVLNLGIIGGVMTAHGRAALFFGLILPHGMLELTAVFVAGGVGLRMFWAWVEPGPRPRLANLAHEARASVTIALGLIVVLLVTGIIEAFVTPSGLPTWARIGIGVLAEVLFFAYVFGPGRRAVLAGDTGDVEEWDREALVPTAG
ncbi:stage II sporulation protein M [Calidifontibacter sp. DB0510]|uniref:Stage II sporulation protein M n=1 Tax=Metallococcus carri TaxID=1656884 RepID=A0A967EFD7_9MICO|nr:stage II sporulation protein M [Metallococcus carri]NHN56536.1 stage II sporulation protein M [Metallococcus carri]NOP38835.1 stage II sporulation protein M [Calidifontibacter sp. DB2511S]